MDEELATYMLEAVWDPLEVRGPREAAMQNRRGDDALIQVMKNADKSKFRVTATYYQVGITKRPSQNPTACSRHHLYEKRATSKP